MPLEWQVDSIPDCPSGALWPPLPEVLGLYTVYLWLMLLTRPPCLLTLAFEYARVLV